MKEQKNLYNSKNIKAIIINQDGLGLDELSNILSKYEELEIAGIINLVEQSNPNHVLQRISLWKGKSIIFVNPLDVVYLAANNGQVSVVTNAETFTSNYSLNYWEQKLKDSFFFRCHKKYLVNMERIDEVIPFFDNTYIIKFKGLKDEVTVSRNYIKEFRKKLLI